MLLKCENTGNWPVELESSCSVRLIIKIADRIYCKIRNSSLSFLFFGILKILILHSTRIK